MSLSTVVPSFPEQHCRSHLSQLLRETVSDSYSVFLFATDFPGKQACGLRFSSFHLIHDHSFCLNAESQSPPRRHVPPVFKHLFIWTHIRTNRANFSSTTSEERAAFSHTSIFFNGPWTTRSSLHFKTRLIVTEKITTLHRFEKHLLERTLQHFILLIPSERQYSTAFLHNLISRNMEVPLLLFISPPDSARQIRLNSSRLCLLFCDTKSSDLERFSRSGSPRCRKLGSHPMLALQGSVEKCFAYQFCLLFKLNDRRSKDSKVHRPCGQNPVLSRLISTCSCFYCAVDQFHAASTQASGFVVARPQSKRPSLHRPRSSCSGHEFLLATCVPVSSGTIPRRHGQQPTNQKTSRTEGLAQTCWAISQCRTSHRSLKSMTEELWVLSCPLVGVPHCLKLSTAGFRSPTTSVWCTYTVAAAKTIYFDVISDSASVFLVFMLRPLAFSTSFSNTSASFILPFATDVSLLSTNIESLPVASVPSTIKFSLCWKSSRPHSVLHSLEQRDFVWSIWRPISFTTSTVLSQVTFASNPHRADHDVVRVSRRGIGINFTLVVPSSFIVSFTRGTVSALRQCSASESLANPWIHASVPSANASIPSGIVWSVLR